MHNGFRARSTAALQHNKLTPRTSCRFRRPHTIANDIVLINLKGEIAMSKTQGSGFYRFNIGTFEAASVSDGFLQFEDPKTMIAAGASNEEYRTFLESKFLSP